MDNDGAIRRYAREAQEMAARSRDEKDRASWLRIAQRCLKMLSPRRWSAEDRLENDAKTPDAGQDPSKDLR